MDNYLKTGLWQQFGAAIDYLDNVISACPDELWRAALWQTPDSRPERAEFWYVAYHSLFWLDLYLTSAEEGFLPPAPFALIEQYGDEPMPERAYTRAELLAYLKGCREKCRATIEGLTDEIAQWRCQFGWGECTFSELLIYNLRHVHGHASQLDMLLGQNGILTPDYPTRADRNAL